jgi:hypothetical protein
MAAYTLTTPTIANGNSGIPHISGRGLRRRRLSRQDRVRLAADVIAREAQLDLSIRQASDLLGVAATKVGAELRARAAAQEAEKATSLLIEAWEAASALEREQAIRTIGVDVVWDALANIVA